MNMLFAVNRKPHQKPVIPEKCRPFFVDQNTIGLQTVAELVWFAVFFLQFHRFFEKIQSHQCGLAPLPAEIEPALSLFRRLPDHFFQNFFTHTMLVPCEQFFFLQVKAIVAGQITIRAGWFHQHKPQGFLKSKAGGGAFCFIFRFDIRHSVIGFNRIHQFLNF